MTNNQRGWKFEPYEENEGAEGYFTFRFGGPLYGIVERQEAGWIALVCLEQGDAEMAPVETHMTAGIARQAVLNSITSILATWQDRFEQVVAQETTPAGTRQA